MFRQIYLLPGNLRARYKVVMKHIDTSKHRGFFKVLADGDSSQAAMMVLRPGQSSSDEPTDEHPRCEQWLFVIRGSGRATNGRKRIALKPNSLLLIEKNERHQIINTGKTQLVTLNLYSPRAYTKAGDVKVT